MGQGLYTKLGYGVFAAPEIIYEESDDFDYTAERLLPVTESQLLDYSSEAKPNCMFIPLAVDDEFLQGEGEIPDLPYDAIGGMVGIRKAKHVMVDESLLDEDFRSRIQQAKEEWPQIHQGFADAGIGLPQAGFILVNDWD